MGGAVSEISVAGIPLSSVIPGRHIDEFGLVVDEAAVLDSEGRGLGAIFVLGEFVVVECSELVSFCDVLTEEIETWAG